jgi:hypothetical protein
MNIFSSLILDSTPGECTMLFLPRFFNFQALFTYSEKQQEALKLLVTKKFYWALFYMPLYMLNVLEQIANKIGKEKNRFH